MTQEEKAQPGQTAGGEAPQRAPKSFLQTVAELNYGSFADECTKELRAAILAVARTEKGAKLTISIDIKKPNKHGQCEVAASVMAKLPREEIGTSIMFISPEFNLQRSDPRQKELEGMRVVADNKGGESVRVGEGEQRPAERVA